MSTRALSAGSQPISYLMKQGLTNPDVISLAAGFVDFESLPVQETRELLGEMLSDDKEARSALQYGTTEGLAELRRVLLEHMVKLDGLGRGDISASADEVIITNGSQQLLFTLVDVLVDPGDIVITGWPSYFVYMGVLEAASATVRCVEMDDNGIVPSALEKLLAGLAAAGDLRRVKIVYLCTYHQNPTGITLSTDRKEVILNIVRRFSMDHRILLLEDAAYRELTYEGVPPPSFKYWDRENEYVALLQTFSKPYAPGLRVGYGLLPRELAKAVIIQKGNHDFGSSNFSQHLLLRAMRGGQYVRHLDLLREHYAAKRDAMLAALTRHLADFHPPLTHWTHPTGGLYVYLTLPDWIDTGREGELFSRALDEGVIYVPGAFCHPPDSTRTAPGNSMRLSFGVANPEQIYLGIERLARAIRSIKR